MLDGLLDPWEGWIASMEEQCALFVHGAKINESIIVMWAKVRTGTVRGVCCCWLEM